ncbi:MAG TPA: sigma 54-interacting transcriptional regulator [Polyangiaceae bacterium]|nr:sigma 54-interacting transcriptional regulator [Polyangiaceae bacterium]
MSGRRTPFEASLVDTQLSPLARADVGQAFDAQVARSARMQDLHYWIERAASAKSPVLIQGETGTGKERVALALHERGPRSANPLRVINCAAIPDTLAEALLFGHERGAYTGANASQAGLFEEAQHGTLFLDEIGELPSRIQAMLLRVLETKRVRRIGSAREIEIDVRIVAATHRDLEAMVRMGQFREDLLYRLNALVLCVPPLRERREEIVPLARELLAEVAKDVNHAVTHLSPAALAALVAYDWPGNVRQLRNVIERALLVCRGSGIEHSDLPPALARAHSLLPIAASPSPSASDAREPTLRTFREQVQAFETDLLRRALANARGNQRAASRRLGIPLRTLAHKIKAYRLGPWSVDSQDEGAG